jgi:hypothetical protein
MIVRQIDFKRFGFDFHRLTFLNVMGNQIKRSSDFRYMPLIHWFKGSRFNGSEVRKRQKQKR